MNYYNEHDPNAAAWLCALIADGVIPSGEVDTRSIIDVQAHELTSYAQCHFFAGIGGWSYALQLAGWPVERPVWTGSCPCQPFSAAGQGMGEADPRHLWPVFRNLIGQCRPPVVFGEQVASIAGLRWFDGVCADMEAAGYAIGASDLCAASVGAPHIRQRLFWVADSRPQSAWRSVCRPGEGAEAVGEWPSNQLGGSGGAGWVANSRLPESSRRNGKAQGSERRTCDELASHGDTCGLANADGSRPLPGAHAGIHCGEESGGARNVEPERHGATGGLEPSGRRAGSGCGTGGMGGSESEQTGLSRFAWGQSDAVACADGKARCVESGTFPLAHGIPGRVGLLRGYGNAIVPQVAARFVEAWVYSANY